MAAPIIPAFQSVEKQVADKMLYYLSDEVLSYDIQIVEAITSNEGNWIPLEIFTQSRLRITKDDAVVANAVRTFAKELEVSEDGKMVRRRIPLPDYAEIDTRTVYIERLPPRATERHITDLFYPFGRVQRVIFSKMYGDESKHAGFAFAIFEKASDAARAVDAIGGRFRKMLPDVDLKSFTEEEVNLGGLGEVRVMSKTQWRALTNEYAALLKRRKEELFNVIQGQMGTHEKAEYQSRIVAKFSGAHKSTTPKVLKRLFEMIAPVSFIDLNRNQGSGHVRFKTSHGARLAFVFFSREYIAQTHKDDLGTLLPRQTKKNNQEKRQQAATEASEWGEWDDEAMEEMVSENADEAREKEDEEKPPKWPNIQLEILTGQAEVAYWNLISQRQQQKEWHQRHEKTGDTTPHSTSDGIAKTHAPAVARRHVKFARSDDEDESEERNLETSTATHTPTTHLRFADSDEEDNPKDASGKVEEELGARGEKRKLDEADGLMAGIELIDANKRPRQNK
ncbi:uncharacterized protein SPPG_00615 [Spizellomyces punctatus DAOM BR117]|uniref:La-related protein 7 n=1 Tax=Spizellomyces punctatus (strain DAOM BR117) TaxID=645134 RepID=A0A0L0HVL2_SPIPD|nr:uncharacterized protein SPPG_00615 [Spizellomyces punctatus DAOM BR117]KND04924.1 hypothetical protein SPPG_00615 [Spizellomyces punctatus DAOM BR117]|eukprot:XP_016612963.1 hypothetical protein SPPG_00615 [Spizellomyces punctatus DAOM BR117]